MVLSSAFVEYEYVLSETVADNDRRFNVSLPTALGAYISL